MSLMPLALRVCRAVKAAGGRALAVGGFPRDLLMLGHSTGDIDLEVYKIEPQRLLEILQRIDPLGHVDQVGQAFCVFKLGKLDISIPRRDNKQRGAPGRGFVVEGDPNMTIEEAAKRRDYTINSMALDLLTQELFDPFNGTVDIRARALVATDLEHFVEDPVRIDRGIQLASRFRLSMYGPTVQRCISMLPERRGVPAQRLREEWFKFLLGQTPSYGLELALQIGLVEEMPEIQALIGCQQHPDWHPEGDVWTHTLQVVDLAARMATDYGLSEERHVTAVLGALCHDLGKPSTTTIVDGRAVSHGHDQAGIEPAKAFMKRFDLHTMNGFPVRSQVLQLVDCHLRPQHLYTHALAQEVKGLKWNPAGAIRRLCLEVDHELLQIVSRADTLGRVPSTTTHTLQGVVRPLRVDAIDWFMNQVEQLDIAPERKGPTPLLRGQDLLDRELMSPGPVMGAVLRMVLDAQIEGSITTFEEAMNLAKNLIRLAERSPESDPQRLPDPAPQQAE